MGRIQRIFTDKIQKLSQTFVSVKK
jgi:hypothetical protein